MPKKVSILEFDQAMWFTVGVCMAYKRNRLTPAEQVAVLHRLGVNVQADQADETSINKMATMVEDWANRLDLPPWDV